MEDFRTYFTEIGWGGVDWIHLSWDRNHWLALVNTEMKLGVP